jgi:glycosyltransferase involved in cell wall biosynthesis
MSNILFVYQRKMATSEGMYEIFMGKTAIQHGLKSRFVTTDKVTERWLHWADAVVFVRNQDLLAQMLIKKARSSGAFCIQFFDDDVLSLPRSAVNRVQYLPWRKKAVRDGFTCTDLILSSNKALGEKYAQLIPANRSVTIHTAVEQNLLISPEEKKTKCAEEEVKIVYAAGANHEGMFDQFILPTIPKLIERYGRRVSFTFFGVHPDVSRFERQIKIRYISAMPLNQYRKEIQRGDYDIGLSPLESNEFTKYKYFNKFIEYTIAGTVGIYSRALPYTLIIEDEKNGFLADNDADSWFQALCKAIDDCELRKNCYQNAYDLITTQMEPNHIIQKFKEDIPELECRRKNKRVCIISSKAKFLLFRFIECFYLVVVYMKLAGIRGTAVKIQSYIHDQRAARNDKLDN